MSLPLPPLARRHRNFFVAITGLAMFHLFFGLTQILYPERYEGIALSRIHEYIPMWVWAWKGILLWALMTYGVFKDRWLPVRVALGIGMFFAIVRIWLLESTADAHNVGGGSLLWGILALMHFVQLSEPEKKVLYVDICSD